MSERNYRLGSDNDETLSSSAESEEAKSKKEKDEKKKRKQRQKKREEVDKASPSRRFAEQDDSEPKRASFLESYLGVEKVSADKAEKRKAKKEKDEKASTDSPESTAKDTPEGSVKNVEKLDDTEAVEATEAYIAARSRQLDELAGHREPSAAAETEDEDRGEEDVSAVRANLRFLAALRRNLHLRRSAPDESMLEASLQETIPGVETNSSEAQDEPEATDAMENTRQHIVESSEQGTPDATAHPPSGELADDSVVHLSAISSPESADSRSSGSSGVEFQQTVPVDSRSTAEQAAGPAPSVERGSHRSRAGDFLLGGFVGYLLGKRRGRIKTEQQLEPARASLEREVSQLEQTIRRYEDRARSAVREQESVLSPDHYHEPTQETSTHVGGEDITHTTQMESSKTAGEQEIGSPSPHMEKDANPALSLAQRAQEQSESVERVQEKTTEHLTGMGVAREAISYESGAAESWESGSSPALTPERIDTMPTSSLLRYVEAIHYNQTDVRSLFERGEVSDAVLRGALKEHLRGNRVDNYLDKELRKRQQSPETYDPERMQTNQGPIRDTILPTPKNHASSKEGQLSAHYSEAADPVSTPAVDAEQNAQRLQAQRMKQASLGAVLGFIVVVFLWFLLGGARLI